MAWIWEDAPSSRRAQHGGAGCGGREAATDSRNPRHALTPPARRSLACPAPAAAWKGKGCEDKIIGESKTYGITGETKPKETVNQESRWKSDGAIKKLNLYYSWNHGCLQGWKPTFGYKAKGASIIGHEKNLYTQHLDLADYEGINKVDIKQKDNNKCVRAACTRERERKRGAAALCMRPRAAEACLHARHTLIVPTLACHCCCCTLSSRTALAGRCIEYIKVYTNKGKSLAFGNAKSTSPVQTATPAEAGGFLAYASGEHDIVTKDGKQVRAVVAAAATGAGWQRAACARCCCPCWAAQAWQQAAAAPDSVAMHQHGSQMRRAPAAADAVACPAVARAQIAGGLQNLKLTWAKEVCPEPVPKPEAPTPAVTPETPAPEPAAVPESPAPVSQPEPETPAENPEVPAPETPAPAVTPETPAPVVTPAEVPSCPASPSMCDVTAAQGTVAYCPVTSPFTAPRCEGGCCVSSGKCKLPLCRLNNMGADVVALDFICYAKNSGLFAGLNKCRNLACKLAVPGCQSGLLGGNCVGSVVAVKDDVDAQSKQYIGKPCIEVHSGHSIDHMPLNALGMPKPDDAHVAGLWTVCDCFANPSPVLSAIPVLQLKPQILGDYFNIFKAIMSGGKASDCQGPLCALLPQLPHMNLSLSDLQIPMTLLSNVTALLSPKPLDLGGILGGAGGAGAGAGAGGLGAGLGGLAGLVPQIQLPTITVDGGNNPAAPLSLPDLPTFDQVSLCSRRAHACRPPACRPRAADTPPRADRRWPPGSPTAPPSCAPPSRRCCPTASTCRSPTWPRLWRACCPRSGLSCRSWTSASSCPRSSSPTSPTWWRRCCPRWRRSRSSSCPASARWTRWCRRLRRGSATPPPPRPPARREAAQTAGGGRVDCLPDEHPCALPCGRACARGARSVSGCVLCATCQGSRHAFVGCRRHVPPWPSVHDLMTSGTAN